MEVITEKLSSLNSHILNNRINNLNFKQFYRSYSGGYKINFPNCFKNLNDNKTINYSNFYLTDLNLLTDICDNNPLKFKSTTITTKLKYSNSNYLSFSMIDPEPYKYVNNFRESYNYGVGIFEQEANDYFTIKFLDYNKCNISYQNNNDIFYLCSDIDNNVVFVKKHKLTFNENYINPQDFIYMFSESGKDILFFKKTPSGDFILTKENNLLKLQRNIVDYIQVPFTIDRNIYSYPDISLNTSFITYSNNNTVDLKKSELNLHNNFLIHKKILDNNDSDIVLLKNQLSQIDVFTCSNNLLSNYNVPIDHFREYTNICQDIIEENSNDLKLNYVFFNKTYKISPGITKFKVPSSIYPFSKLNINDTTFIKSGAFSFLSPEYSDKIFKISENITEKNNKQHLLCTWLSGNPTSNDKVWVDRYYYPDVISKEEALAAESIDYDSYLESLVTSDVDLKEKISIIKFFDKKSDLCFQPNEEYEYYRIDKIPELTNNISLSCGKVDNYPLNYFKKINDSGKFTLIIYFNQLDEPWTIESDKNDIDGVISIKNEGDNLYFRYSLYDSTYDKYEKFEFKTTIKLFNYNVIAVSVDSISGNGYLFINSEVVYKFNITPYKYTKKHLLYGDFFLYTKDEKLNLLSTTNNQIENVYISHDYLNSDYLGLISLLKNNKIEPIYISLPCGMRNNLDQISILNELCGSTSFKSNKINIIMKNIDEPEGLNTFLENNLKEMLPISIKIEDIQYKSYKNL